MSAFGVSPAQGTEPTFGPGRPAGRARTYPSFVWILWQELFSIFGTHRAVERELGRGGWWRLVRREVHLMFSNDPSMHLPQEAPRRHHFEYYRDRYLARDDIASQLLELHRQTATAQAMEVGMLDPDGGGSPTHPAVSRTLYGDGKVVTLSGAFIQIRHAATASYSWINPPRTSLRRIFGTGADASGRRAPLATWAGGRSSSPRWGLPSL